MLVFMGLAGAGKSTVLNKFLEVRKDVKKINYGDLAVEVAINKKLVTDRDKINSLTSFQHKKLQEDVVKQLKEKDSPKTILDTHAILRHNPGYIAGITPELMKKINIEGFVFIDASPDEILLRRKSDPTRTRSMLTKEQIDEDRMLSKALICGYVSITGVPFYFVHNKQGNLDNAVDEIRKIVEDLGWKE
jgi:adenylate kinase